MNRIIILTATYNDASCIDILYRSLCAQVNKNFLWIIVNDGSSDNTIEVVNEFIKENRIEIKFLNKANGGKSSAINVGLDIVQEEDFVLIVDADEEMNGDTTKILKEYCTKYSFDKSIGIIHFHRIDSECQEVIASKVFDDDIVISPFCLRKQRYHCDGYVGYFGYAIKNIRFPIMENEKYIAPSVLMTMVAISYKMILSKHIIGKTKYGEEGITKQGRKLRVKNPLGMLYLCVLLQDKRAGVLVNIKYSICGYAYIKISGKSRRTLLGKGIFVNKFNPLMKLPGILLAQKWKWFL